ncbi:MAG: NUDIX domain-containing protein [Polyangiaceae bacterium]|nr:NUDIX domain-containing protein [Polyangiaceae bacterium]
MAYTDRFRLSAHAVILNAEQQVLQLRATYGEKRWGLPGGALEPGETPDVALCRECHEELGVAIQLGPLTGVYYHATHESQVFIFKVTLPAAPVVLSPEHSELNYFPLDSLSSVQRIRVDDCLSYDGSVRFNRF